MNFYVLVSTLIMALVTYLIRMLPLTLMRKRLKNPFLRSILAYAPYGVLSSMTIPHILYSTSSPISAAVGLAAAAVLAFMEKGLLCVALGASAAVFIVELFV